MLTGGVDGVLREGWGSACKFNDIDEGCGYPNACTDSYEIRQLSNESTYCFDWLFLYDWLETSACTVERGATYYHAGTITHYFLSYNLCLYQANDMMSYHFSYLY